MGAFKICANQTAHYIGVPILHLLKLWLYTYFA